MTRAIDDLLPLYVGGAATADERAEVEAALRSDPALDAELRFWRALAAEVAADATAERPSPGGWGRLEAALDAARTPPLGVVGLANGLTHRLERPANANAPGGVSPWWRPLAVAACLLVAVQAAFTLQDGPRAPATAPAGALTTASGEIGASTDTVLQVAFRPGATEGAIRALLLDVDAALIDGPSAIGLYKIAFATAKARAEGLSVLEASTGVVESVTP